jgi:hypothetical protein
MLTDDLKAVLDGLNLEGMPRATFDAMIEGLQKDHPNFLRRSRSSSSAPGC